MPLFLPTPCKTCGTGQPWPADARFCRTCGRPARWTETAGGRWRVAVAVTFAVVLLVSVVGLALVLTTTVRHVVAVPARVAPRPPAAARPVPTPPAPPVVPPVTPPVDPPSATPDAAADPPAVPAVPARPGDTDLATDPLALYAGGPPADRLTVRGLGIGVALSAVPAALLDESAPDHLRDLGGNLYAIDDRRISEVHLRDPALLARWPIDGLHALAARFGPADLQAHEDGSPLRTFEYLARGIHVRWDDDAGRIDEVVLVRPGAVRP